MNDAAKHVGMQASLGAAAFSSLEYVPISGIAGSYSNLIFRYLKDHQTVP